MLSGSHTLYLISFSNGKNYVGYTSKPLEKRISQHKMAAKHRRKLPVHKAMNSLSYVYSVINTYYTAELAYRMEAEYIKRYNSDIKSNGYNVAAGGQVNIFDRPYLRVKVRVLNQPDLIFNSLQEAAKYYQVSPQSIYRVCSGTRRSIKGDYLCYEKDYQTKLPTLKTLKRRLDKKAKPIVDEFGTVYESLAEAGRELGCAHEEVRVGIINKSMVHGRSFCYYTNETKVCPRYKDKRYVIIHCSNNNTTYKSLKKAAEELDLKYNSLCKASVNKGSFTFKKLSFTVTRPL